MGAAARAKRAHKISFLRRAARLPLIYNPNYVNTDLEREREREEEEGEGGGSQ